jgi:hypothetical protein
VRIVEEAFRAGVIVKDVARRLGIHEKPAVPVAPTDESASDREHKNLWGDVAGGAVGR